MEATDIFHGKGSIVAITKGMSLPAKHIAMWQVCSTTKPYFPVMKNAFSCMLSIIFMKYQELHWVPFVCY